MYKVYLGDSCLYYPGSTDAVIFDTELNEEVGKAGEFTFKVPPDNLIYSELTTGALVTIFKDNKEFWRGEICDIKTDFNKIAEVYVLEDLAWLGNEFLPPASNTTETYAQRFQSVIASYNQYRPAERQFSVGMITNVQSTGTCNWVTEYDQSILDGLRNCICGENGYLRVRRAYSGGTLTRYIDIVRLEDYGVMATQAIEYGYNLLNYVKDADYGNLANVITPYGAETDSEIYEGYNARLQGTTITQTDSVNAYGRHFKPVIFDDVTDLTELNAKAQEYLTKYSQPLLTMEVEAVDLEDIENADAINIGDQTRILAQPFAIDQWLYLTQIKRDIQNKDKNKLTMASEVQVGKTLTSKIMGTNEAVKNIPSKSSILDAARKNALAILDGTDGGNIQIATNAQGQLAELRIANNVDYDQATKCWRANLGGWAYQHRDTAADEWEVITAATMDGGFVADFITSGTLKLAGNGSCAILEIYDQSGTLIGRWNKDGIYAAKGTFAGSLSAATGTFAGSLSAATGTFSGNLSAAGGTFKGSLSAADGTFKGKLTASSGGGELSISSGDLHMDNNKSGGPGLYMTKGSDLYACWGARNCAAQADGAYREVSAMAIMRAAENASDRRLKQDIEDLDDDIATKLIMSIKAKTFKFKKEPNELNFGVIAQDIRKIEKAIGIDTENNRLCYTNEVTGMYSVDYTQLIAPMIKVIQNQQEQINKLMERRKDG